MSSQINEITAHWDDQYADGKYFGKPMAKEVLKFFVNFILPEHIGKLSDIKVLDDGCGSGKNLIGMATMGLSVFGIETSKVGVEQCQEKLQSLGFSKNVEWGDFKQLPYQNETFNVVIAHNVLQHGDFADIRKTISEMSRVLLPGGFIFISVRHYLRAIPTDAVIYQDDSIDGVSFTAESDKNSLILHHLGQNEIINLSVENNLLIVYKSAYQKPKNQNDTMPEKWHWDIVLKKN